jgi:hypothetical protein
MLVSALGAGLIATSLGFYGSALAAPPSENNVPPGWEKNLTEEETTLFHGGSQNECETCDEGGPGVRTEKETSVGPQNNPHSFDTEEESGPDPQGPK